MGIIYPDDNGRLVIRSLFYFYGTAASKDLAIKIANDIAYYWNEPAVVINGRLLYFDIEGIYEPSLLPETVWYNDDPAKNFFRIEQYSAIDISFVDGIGSNTGYFKLDNLLHTGTTAAHEYGHTIGLEHPIFLDIRGYGTPGIMYPRGTIVDAEFQYNPAAPAGVGELGGTMDATKRKVTANDIALLNLQKIKFRKDSKQVLGDFSSQYHEAHQATTK
ncbi:MAG: peptidase M10 [Bacteroidota bacterium]